jgi:hypothetical protein
MYSDFEQREQKDQTSNIFVTVLSKEESGIFLRRFDGRNSRCQGRFIYTPASLPDPHREAAHRCQPQCHPQDDRTWLGAISCFLMGGGNLLLPDRREQSPAS